MIPDLAIFINPSSVTNFELLLIEVKKHINYSNDNLEKDLVKLGKEMQLALNKLITHNVKNPEVLGLLVEDNKVSTFKMDLCFNGQYRSVELHRFFLIRPDVDDNMLMPNNMQKLNQIRVVM